jgi:adenine-specific DNA-methyltransferase
MALYGPNNPHPLSCMKTELVWEGKYDEFGSRRELAVAAAAMPLQKIETIDEPRSRAEEQGSLFDAAKAHRDDFRNRLIWGDNKLVCASLLAEFRGAFDVVYIDPPFDVGADFTMAVPVGETGELKKDQSILEMVAYRDTWGRGIDSYASMIAERLQIIRDLLRETGSVFVHCDWRVSAIVRLILDELFGRENMIGHIVWQRTNARGTSGRWPRIHDVILHYGKSSAFYFKPITIQADAKKMPHTLVTGPDGLKYQSYELTGPGVTQHGESGRPWRGFDPGKFGRHWGNSPTQMDEWDSAGLIHWPKNNGFPRRRAENPFVAEEREVTVGDVWADIDRINQAAKERLGYETQKPEALVERIMGSAAPEGALVGDFFCGSGTTLAVAEKAGFRWIGCDLGRFAIHTTRKRLINLQRDLHEAGKPYRSFDVYNLGRYERQWWQREALKGADDEHRAVVLKFFKAEPLAKAPSPLLHARKANAFVHVDGIDSIFTRSEVMEVAEATAAAGGKEIYVLAWDFEMDIRQVAAAVEAQTGVKLRLARIPREIMEKNRTEVPPFFEVAMLEAAPVLRKEGKATKVDIKLANFLPSLSEVPSKELEALQERAVASGFDFIDFWAVDFDWAPTRAFNHHWQDFRTRQDRVLKTVSDAGHVYPRSAAYTACVKVVDVFGCDTSITVQVQV